MMNQPFLNKMEINEFLVLKYATFFRSELLYKINHQVFTQTLCVSEFKLSTYRFTWSSSTRTSRYSRTHWRGSNRRQQSHQSSCPMLNILHVEVSRQLFIHALFEVIVHVCSNYVMSECVHYHLSLNYLHSYGYGFSRHQYQVLASHFLPRFLVLKSWCWTGNRPS